ncbi:hypothetical protein CIW48_27395 [Methylobacterium sp. P1-11]|uniref:hypothetical protein n=1 Tax=Methylobacterium sp. P1-11 TaxID=2024616 RepID=UPI0011EEDDEB|nr:hypothetical protein [Methylobacterium sp. P1-11]KAA0117927.1 hypothetical protein CIW48_27395 [Methylobacterium sp. P1-11]
MDANPGSWEPQRYWRYTSYRLEELFTRGRDGWGSRSMLNASLSLAPFIEAGRLRMIMRAIPPLSPRIEKKVASFSNARESAAHMILKHAACRWMRANGAKDAEEEVPGYGGRFDVYSEKADWIAEVGNSNVDKLAYAIMKPTPQRFTLVPYQRQAWRNGKPRRLIGIDFVWDASLGPDLEAALRAQRLAGR